MSILRIITAILLPPLGVFLTVGLGSAFWINILLTLLGYVPGIIHAIWVIAKRQEVYKASEGSSYTSTQQLDIDRTTDRLT
jgi:uncharacterized membrane protein YqaE (UPF0057 family)